MTKREPAALSHRDIETLADAAGVPLWDGDAAAVAGILTETLRALPEEIPLADFDLEDIGVEEFDQRWW